MQRGTKIVLVVIVVASVFAGITFYVESTLRDAFHRQLLVVRATDLVTSNGNAGTGIPANFGPRCANASFAQSGALILDSDSIPSNATGVLYVRYQPDASFAPRSASGDNVALFFFWSDARAVDIVSTANAAVALFRMQSENATVRIDGTVASPTFIGNYTAGIQYRGFTYTVTEWWTITNLGLSTVTVQPPQPCP